VGDYVKYKTGDLYPLEDWYGKIAVVQGYDHEYSHWFYRVDAFNKHYKQMDKSAVNEKYEPQLTAITADSYNTYSKAWIKNTQSQEATSTPKKAWELTKALRQGTESKIQWLIRELRSLRVPEN
jgi:hypothetical protein